MEQIKSQDLKSMVDHRGKGGRAYSSLLRLKVKGERVSEETVSSEIMLACLQYTQ